MKKKFFLKNLIVFLIPLLLSLLILGSLSIIITQSFVKQEISKNNINLLKQTKENMEFILSEIDSLSLNFNTNATIINVLSRILKNRALTQEDILSFNIIKNFLDTPANSKSYIHSIYIYMNNDNGYFISTTEGLVKLNDFYDTSWYETYLKYKGGKTLWIESKTIKQYKSIENTDRIITIYKELWMGNGVIVLNISALYLQNLLNNLTTFKDQSILVFDKENNIVFKNKDLEYLEKIDIQKINSEPKLFFTITIDKNKYTVSKLHSNSFEWEYLSIVPNQTLYNIPIKLSIATFILLFISLILSVILSYFFTNKNYKQLENVFSIIESAEAGRPLPPLPERIKDEYSFIIHNILKTFIEQNYLKVQLSERKYKHQVMELLALQSQVNPHFLFNTLKTIYWKSCNFTGKPNEISDMVENLENILYYSLNNPVKSVTVEEEVKNTMSYIEIQKVRYKDKFDVKWEFSDEVKNLEVVKLLLQPLIENSIYHGIKEKEGKSYIKIRFDNTDDQLRISVIDNGLGISHDKLIQIRRNLNEEGDFSEHIGLFNTNKRLKLAYGEQYGISIRSKPGSGTVIYIRIPLRETVKESTP